MDKKLKEVLVACQAMASTKENPITFKQVQEIIFVLKIEGLLNNDLNIFDDINIF